MVNLFFVKERCPLSLSLAGYFMNKGDMCIEIYDDIQFIINSRDVTSLCFAASNVDAIIKNYKAQRIFVQEESKNLSAVTLGSVLNELPVYLVCAENSHQTFRPPMLGEFVNRVIPTASTQNFLDSACGNELREKVADEELTLVTSTFPPKHDWFYEYLYYSVDPPILRVTVAHRAFVMADCFQTLCSDPWETNGSMTRPIHANVQLRMPLALPRSHAFVDGNNRTAFVTSATFLLLNGWHFEAEPIE